MQGLAITVIFTILSVAVENKASQEKCADPLSLHSACKLHHLNCTYKLKVGSCISCDNSSCAVTLGECFFDMETTGLPALNLASVMYYLASTLSCNEINERLCGALNRNGVLCSQCLPGYGPAPYSSDTKCFKCNRSLMKQWTLYLTLELVPATSFYLVVMLFNVRITAPPYTAIIFFCQFFSFLYKIHPYIRTGLKQNTNRAVLQTVLTLNGFWNLDYFRHVVPPFCISSNLSDVDVVLLESISAFYPLVLVATTYIFVELHARNFQPVVILWKPFSKNYAKCRRKLDPKASTIAAFATFISLSFNKSLVVSVMPTFSATINILGSHTPSKYRGIYDASIHGINSNDYLAHLARAPYFIPMLLLFIAVQLHTVLLLLYPVRIFRKFLACCGSSRYHAISVFIDTFQGHYKDGTNGSRDYRAASSISFLIRSVCIFLLFNVWSRIGEPILDDNYKGIIYLTTGCSLFYGIVQPCKKKYMNIVESVVYSFAGLTILSLGSLHGLDPSQSSHDSGDYVQLYISLIFLALPSLVILVMLFAKIFSCLLCGRECKGAQVVKTFLQRCKQRDHGDEMNYAIADRLEHPENYETLP